MKFKVLNEEKVEWDKKFYVDEKTGKTYVAAKGPDGKKVFKEYKGAGGGDGGSGSEQGPKWVFFDTKTRNVYVPHTDSVGGN